MSASNGPIARAVAYADQVITESEQILAMPGLGEATTLAFSERSNVASRIKEILEGKE